MQNITEQNINIEVIASFVIHGDDTISIIKKKIVRALNLELSTKEVYLFGVIRAPITPNVLYKQLTQNESIPLTENRMCDFILNIVGGDCKDIDISSTCELIRKFGDNISYDDFLNILDWDMPQVFTVPIGRN